MSTEMGGVKVNHNYILIIEKNALF